MPANQVQRRPLRFSNLDEVQAEVQSLAAADQTQTLKSFGNWTLGQTLNHLATWGDYCFDGVPMKIPLIVRLVMRPMKNRMLYKPMRANLRIPRVPDGTLATQVVPLVEALPHFQKSFQRLGAETPSAPHMFFGKLTKEQWISLNLRHAELHLSFFSC